MRHTHCDTQTHSHTHTACTRVIPKNGTNEKNKNAQASDKCFSHLCLSRPSPRKTLGGHESLLTITRTAISPNPHTEAHTLGRRYRRTLRALHVTSSSPTRPPPNSSLSPPPPSPRHPSYLSLSLLPLSLSPPTCPTVPQLKISRAVTFAHTMTLRKTPYTRARAHTHTHTHTHLYN